MIETSSNTSKFQLHNSKTKNQGRALISIITVLFHLATFMVIWNSHNMVLLDYLATWFLGIIFASIELASRYKDDPPSVLTSSPGALYLAINGLICLFGLYLMNTFGLGYEVDDSLPLLSQRTFDVLQASLSSFFIMRSSFLKLGHNSQIDLGLNAILKKILEIIDREVDRVRAVKRSNDITKLFNNVHCDKTKHIFKLCLNVMQNVSTEEAAGIQRLVDDLESVIGSKDSGDSDMDLKLMQLEIGLALYNIVGISVLEAAVRDLDVESSNDINMEDPEFVTKLKVSIQDQD
ncbi:TPA: hypothetical protein ACX6RX_003113 [Photobacterium damselae]